MSIHLSTVVPESAAGHSPVVQEALERLDLSVEQLLVAALARARHAPAPRAARVPATATPPRPARPLASLSPREREVLQRLAVGDSNKMIARTLELSPHTVKRHVVNILDKLGARSRGQAAAWWLTQHPPVQGH